MSALVELHKKLVDEWAKDAKRDIANVEKILADIKVLSFLV